MTKKQTIASVGAQSLNIAQGKGEYLVRFDGGREEYVNTEWLDRLENE